jgi:amino-acid N-acetyltransferase
MCESPCTQTDVTRKPKVTEVPEIKRLIELAAREGALLPRSLSELYEGLRDFFVYVDEQGVAGCCALHVDQSDLAEIRSLVVRENLRRRGIGRRLVEACIREALQLDVVRVYTLTRSRSFFEKQGFRVVDRQELPRKIFRDCVRCHLFPGCDEIAMVLDLKEYHGSDGRVSEEENGP